MIKNILILTTILLSGCASQQTIKKEMFNEKSNEILFSEIEKLKQDENDYEEIEIKLVEVINQEIISDKKIKFDFTGKATLKDLMDVLEFYGISLIISDDVNIEKNILINKWNGSLRDLSEAIGETTNLSIREKRGVLYIEKEKSYKIKVVQDKEIIEAVKEELTKMEEKIKDLVVSDVAGIISFKSDFKTFKKIEDVITELNQNTSLIKMDLSLVNLTLDETSGEGFDWSGLNVAANLDAEDLLEKGLSFTGNGRLGITGSNFNMSMVMNVLNEYGQSETVQNTSIRTLSGKEAIFKTAEKTPFLDKVETTENGEFAKTGFTTSEAETGLEVKVLAYFDKDSKMVNTKIDMVKSSLKGYMTISGSDTEVKQPITEEQSFSSVIRLRAGESSVIGGIIYYKEKKEGNNLISEMTQSNKKELTKNALFIIFKPSVKAYIYK